jgi:hypothetical protein
MQPVAISLFPVRHGHCPDRARFNQVDLHRVEGVTDARLKHPEER